MTDVMNALNSFGDTLTMLMGFGIAIAIADWIIHTIRQSGEPE